MTQLRERLARFDGYLQRDPGNADLLYEAAELLMQLGEHARANQLLQQGLAAHPHHPRLTALTASVAMSMNRPDEAIRLLQELIRAGTNDPVLHYNLAYAHMLAGRYAEARDILQELAKNPGDAVRAPVMLARALHHLGDLENAVPPLKAYLETFLQDAEAWGQLALIQLDAERNTGAREAAQKALALDPANLYGEITLGSLALADQDAEHAHRYFEEAVQHQPRSGRAWAGRGLTAMLEFDLEHALEYLQHAVQHMPDHIGTWHALAWCQIAGRDLAGAETSFGRAMELDHSFDETHGGLAVVLILQNQAEKAEDHVRRALRLNPKSFAGRFAQSLLMARNDPEKAQDIIRRILKSSPTAGGATLVDSLQRTARRRHAVRVRKPHSGH